MGKLFIVDSGMTENGIGMQSHIYFMKRNDHP